MASEADVIETGCDIIVLTAEDMFLFINAREENPCLWQTSHPQYKSRPAQTAAQLRIAQLFNRGWTDTSDIERLRRQISNNQELRVVTTAAQPAPSEPPLRGNGLADTTDPMMHCKFPVIEACEMDHPQKAKRVKKPNFREETEILLEEECDAGHLTHKWCSQPILNRRMHSGDFLIGDCRNNSPRHSAQYCTYTVMEEDTNRILTLQTNKRQTELKSIRLEKEYFVAAMADPTTKNISVKDTMPTPVSDMS
ncbi:hypothetical protein BaRGS_00027577 [Batillaria attramentaria]|uniref:MADF domain-containing protein n=1 Tax=Batillaria attramentaria TaxID=370345 RepID=A0ABD0K1N0_9CAEN